MCVSINPKRMKKFFLSFLSFLYIGLLFAQDIKIDSCSVFMNEDYVRVAAIYYDIIRI